MKGRTLGRFCFHWSIACCLLGGTAVAQPIDNETVTIMDSFQAFNGYDVEYVLDTDEDLRFLSDFASQGGSDETYIEFDFGQSHTFTEIIFTDRVTSGGGNLGWVGGLHDYNTLFSYTFSVDDDFTNGDGVTDDIVIEVEPEEPFEDPVPQDQLELLQTTTPIPNISAHYLRWDILETYGANPGAADFEFHVGTSGGLEAGDADMDYDFDQLDLVQVQIAAKYLSTQAGNLGRRRLGRGTGRWPGNPPAGDGLFNQMDIIAALNAGKYLTGPYARFDPGGSEGDGQTSVVYDARTGEVAVDAPAGTELTSINIDSASGIFTGDPAQNLGGSFDNDADNNIFKATFGSSFGSHQLRQRSSGGAVRRVRCQ